MNRRYARKSRRKRSSLTDDGSPPSVPGTGDSRGGWEPSSSQGPSLDAVEDDMVFDDEEEEELKPQRKASSSRRKGGSNGAGPAFPRNGGQERSPASAASPLIAPAAPGKVSRALLVAPASVDGDEMLLVGGSSTVYQDDPYPLSAAWYFTRPSSTRTLIELLSLISVRLRSNGRIPSEKCINTGLVALPREAWLIVVKLLNDSEDASNSATTNDKAITGVV